MKLLAWLAMLVVALVVLIPPAGAKRDGRDKRPPREREESCFFTFAFPGAFEVRFGCQSDDH